MTVLHTLKQLPISERIELVQELWKSIAANPHALAVSAEQQAILDARLTSYDQDKATGRHADVVLRDIRDNL